MYYLLTIICILSCIACSTYEDERCYREKPKEIKIHQIIIVEYNENFLDADSSYADLKFRLFTDKDSLIFESQTYSDILHNPNLRLLGNAELVLIEDPIGIIYWELSDVDDSDLSSIFGDRIIAKDGIRFFQPYYCTDTLITEGIAKILYELEYIY